MRPILAGSGADAIPDSRRHDPLSLVLTDVHMPGMDGFELADYTKLTPALSPSILLSSGSGLGDMERCRRTGVAACLTKPVSQRELQETILRALGGRQQSQSGANGATVTARGCATRSLSRAAPHSAS